MGTRLGRCGIERLVAVFAAPGRGWPQPLLNKRRSIK